MGTRKELGKKATVKMWKESSRSSFDLSYKCSFFWDTFFGEKIFGRALFK